MKKFIQSFLAVFTIVFTIGIGFSFISDQEISSYHKEVEYEHSYGEGVMADKIMNRTEFEKSEQDTNVYDEPNYLVAQSQGD